MFCLEHRSPKSHECPKSEQKNRRVLICEACSASIEITGCDDGEEKEAMERHERSGYCDPEKKKKPICPVRRCKAVLTFSNTSTCKTCRLKVCLRHRFPADHACDRSPLASPSLASAAVAAGRGSNNKFLAALAAREASDCAKEEGRSASPPTTQSVKAC